MTNIKVAIFQANENDLNKWLKDKEVIDIKPYGGSLDNPYLLIIYKEKSKKNN